MSEPRDPSTSSAGTPGSPAAPLAESDAERAFFSGEGAVNVRALVLHFID